MGNRGGHINATQYEHKVKKKFTSHPILCRRTPQGRNTPWHRPFFLREKPRLDLCACTLILEKQSEGIFFIPSFPPLYFFAFLYMLSSKRVGEKQSINHFHFEIGAPEFSEWIDGCINHAACRQCDGRRRPDESGSVREDPTMQEELVSLCILKVLNYWAEMCKSKTIITPGTLGAMQESFYQVPYIAEEPLETISISESKTLDI